MIVMLILQLHLGKHCGVSWVCKLFLVAFAIFKPIVRQSAKIILSNKWFVISHTRVEIGLNICPWLSWLWTAPLRSRLAYHRLMQSLVSTYKCQLIASMACILCKLCRTKLSNGRILRILFLSICCKHSSIRSAMLILIGNTLSLMLAPRCCY